MGKNISQLKLPDPNDSDPHPRLLLDGYGVHAGQSFTALFPDGWPGLLVHLHPWLLRCLPGRIVCKGLRILAPTVL